MSVDLGDRIVLRHRSGEGYRKTEAALKLPLSTLAFLISRTGLMTNLSNWERRALVMEVTENIHLPTGQ